MALGRFGRLFFKRGEKAGVIYHRDRLGLFGIFPRVLNV